MLKTVLLTAILAFAFMNFTDDVAAQVGVQQGLLDANVSDEKALQALPHMQRL